MMTEVRNLRCLVALARRLNFSRAADDLGISQPSLTRTIQALEQNLGLRLFDRDRSGVRPTAQGRAIIDRAIALVADFDDFDRHAHQVATGEGGRIRIGMAPLPARALLPSVLAERLKTAPRLANDVLVRTMDVLWPLLIADEIEFIVGAEGQVPDNASIRSETLGYFPVSLLVRHDHPLLQPGAVPRPFPVLMASGRGYGSEALASLRGQILGELHFVEDYRTLTELLLRCDAIWLSSPYASGPELDQGLICELPQSAEMSATRLRMMLYSLERRSRSPAARAFKEALQREMRRLVAQFGAGAPS